MEPNTVKLLHLVGRFYVSGNNVFVVQNGQIVRPAHFEEAEFAIQYALDQIAAKMNSIFNN